MKVYKCDHCGNEFSKITYKNYFITRTETHTVNVLKMFPADDCTFETEYNVCNECYEELLKWLGEE